MQKDMTEGSSLRLILIFALPLLMGNLLQQTYNVVDAAIVGRCLGSEALAGVGASGSVQFLILGFCNGTGAGLGIPIAQRFGARDYKTMRDYLFHGYLLSGIIAISLTVICAILCPQILHLLATPDEIFDEAYSYLFIIFLGIPFSVLYNLLASYLRAVGDSRTPFLFLAFSTILNIILDLVCIRVFKWGVSGAAIATIFSQGVSGLLCLILIICRIDVLHISGENCHFVGRHFWTMFTMGVPMGLQFSITAIGSMVMQAANNGLGSIYISAFTAGCKIKCFIMCPFDAIATSVSVFCGQNLGAGRMDRIKKGIRTGLLINIVYGIVSGLVLMLWGRQMSLIFMEASEKLILDASGKYLFCLGTCYTILGALCLWRLALQGLGFSGRAIFAGAAEMVARIFVSAVFVPIAGYTAICWADQAAWLAACIYLLPALIMALRKVQKNLDAKPELL